MKKIMTAALFIYFSSTLISCRKEIIEKSCEQPQFVVSSDWLRLQFDPVFSSSSGGNFASQSSVYHINPAISNDPNKYVKLAYMKCSERGHQYYFPIPGLFNSSIQ